MRDILIKSLETLRNLADSFSFNSCMCVISLTIRDHYTAATSIQFFTVVTYFRAVGEPTFERIKCWSWRHPYRDDFVCTQEREIKMAEKIVARIPAAPGTFRVKEDKTEKTLYLERVIYWNVISDTNGTKPIKDDKSGGYEYLIGIGLSWDYGSPNAYLHPNGTVEVLGMGVTYSCLETYAAERNLTIDPFFCDSECNDVNMLLGKESKDEGINIKLNWNLSKN